MDHYQRRWLDAGIQVILSIQFYDPNASSSATITNSGNQKLVDTNGDGKAETVKITDLDFDLPLGVAGQIDVWGYLFYNNGTQVTSTHITLTVDGNAYDNVTIDLGKVPTTDTYYYTMTVYYSNPNNPDDTYASSSFSVEADLPSSINLGNLVLVDANNDGNPETVTVTNIDPNLPEGTGLVVISVYLYSENGTEISNDIFNATITGNQKDSFSGNLGRVPESGNYFYVTAVYYSIPDYRDDVHFSNIFNVETDGHWTAYIQNVSYETYDGNNDGLKESIRIINFDPNLTNGTDIITIWAVLVNSDTGIVKEININPVINNDQVDTITIDFGAVPSSGSYSITIDVYYSVGDKVDDTYHSAEIPIDLTSQNTNTNTVTGFDTQPTDSGGSSSADLNVPGPSFEVFLFLSLIAIPISKKRTQHCTNKN